MHNIYYIYIYTDPTNNQPFYVGKGKNNRAYENYYSSRSLRVFYKINKILENGYKISDIVSIVEQHMTENEAYEKEIEYIEKYGKVIDNTGCLLNICDGGISPYRRGNKRSKYEMSSKHRKSIRESWTNERKQQMSERLRGKKRKDVWGNNISSGKRNRTKFDKEIFEKYVRDGLKLKDIWNEMNITYDIIRDRMLIHYQTTDFKKIRKILNVSDDIKIRQHQIDFDVLKSLTLKGLQGKDIIKIFNIKCIKTLSRYIQYKYNIKSFSEYKRIILLENNQSSSSDGSSICIKSSNSGSDP